MEKTTHEPGPDKWEEYFDLIAPSLDGMLVTVEVVGDQLGDQLDINRRPLRAISYDPDDKILEVSVGARDIRYPVLLRYFISNPETISVDGYRPHYSRAPLYPKAILATDTSGTRTLIRLFEPASFDAP